jgi:nitroreductase
MKNELLVNLILKRWSPYAFSSAPVEEIKLKTLFEAAGMAPSCNNEQPWLFVYTTQNNKEVFNYFLDFLFESNRIWAKNAFALAISLARMKFSFSGKPNRFAFYDTGMAVSNLLLQAASMEIYVHQMGGFSVEKVKEYLNVPDYIEPVAMMAIGYMGDRSSISTELQNRDANRRLRKEVDEFTFKDRLSDKVLKKG